jgi:hypothetical protein
VSVSLNTLNWSPIIEGKTVVIFVTTAMACAECAKIVVGFTEEYAIDQETREVLGGRIGNVHWRSKSLDISECCDLCGAQTGNRLREELRFWVEVQ